MTYISILISIIEVILLTVLVLLSIAFLIVTVRNTMVNKQRKLGFNGVSYYAYLQTIIINIKTYLHSKRFNIIISLVVYITLLPLKVFFSIFNWMDYYPLVSCVSSALYISLSLLSKEKDLPGKLGFINIIAYSIIISFCIRQGNIDCLPYLFFSFFTSNSLLVIASDNYFNMQRKTVLYMNNQESSAATQQQYNNYNNFNQPTSHDPSLNITSENDRSRVEATYFNEEKRYTDSKVGLATSAISFTKHWDKTKDAVENVNVSYDDMISRIEEAKKKSNILETRLNATLYHRDRAIDAANSLNAWDIRQGLNIEKSKWNFILKANPYLIEKAQKDLAEFRDPARTYNKR
jgi:hypothetical protein